MIITITGTPGTGKTYIAKKISKSKNWIYIDLSAIIKKEKLYDSYDKKDKTYDVDVKRLQTLSKRYKKHKEGKWSIKDFKKETTLSSILKKHSGILIDGHLSHYIDSDICIVVKSDIKRLSERLKKRGYSDKKIKDNIESEIFDVCAEEAKSLKRNLIVVVN